MSDFRFSISDCRIQPRQRWSGRRRGGFTFTEVLFAVMLLGIGFIMVAAIFPVAIQQSQANREDAMGVILAKRGAKIIESMQFGVDELGERANTGLVRYNGKVYPFGLNDNLSPNVFQYSKLVGNLVDRSDARYAWVPLGYKLGPWPTVWPPAPAPQPVPAFCEVYMVGVASRNKAAYDDKDMNPANFTFQPKQCWFGLTEGGPDGPDLITFSSNSGSVAPVDFKYAAEGAYVIVADDQFSNIDPKRTQANGRMYRLGVKRTDLNKGVGVWELAPGKDMTYTPPRGPYPELNENIPPRLVTANPNPVPSGKPAMGFMIGRAYANPLNRGSDGDGAAQDLFATSVIIYFPMQ